MRTSVRFVSAFFTVALVFSGVSCFWKGGADASLYARALAHRPWMPPSWHPAPEHLEVLASMRTETAPKVRGLSARAVYVFDLDSGRVLVSRAAEERRPVASLTKLVTSLAFGSEQPSLDRRACVDFEFWPSRPGARSALSTGECYRGWDLLGAALVASDNRAAFGLQVISGLHYADFIQRMNDVSEDLGMLQSSWADPSGLEDDNLSTARDMARAAVAVAMHPVLSMAAAAPVWDIEREEDGRVRRLHSTDRLVGRPDVEVLAGKTGYTDTAGYCFAGVLEKSSGQRLAVAILGAPRSRDRWSDVERILDL